MRHEEKEGKNGRDVPRVPKRMLKDPPSNPLSNLINSLLQLSSNSLSLQRFNSVRVGSSGHDDECDNSSLGSSFLESGVKSWLSIIMPTGRGCVWRSSAWWVDVV
jgi:hypothetical protein